jgi:hypothetical protein
MPFLALVFLSGCYSKDFKEPAAKDLESFNTERVFQASYNATWTAVTQVLKDLPLVVARKENGYITTDWILGKSDRLYSGYDDTKIPSKIRYRFTITMRPYKDATNVKIVNEEQYYTDAISAGTEFSGSLFQWIDTPSSTQKERHMLDNIETILTTKSVVPAPYFSR